MPAIFGGGKNNAARSAAFAAALLSAGLAGRPAPPENLELEACLEFITESLAAVGEARQNDRREMDRLIEAAGAAREGARPTSPQALEPALPAAGLLALADLRDRLRVLVRQHGEGLPDSSARNTGVDQEGDDVVRWMLERLDDGMRLVGLREFDEAGQVDPRRHQVVERCVATAQGVPGTIARSVRTGLTLHDTVLRPQQVVVHSDEGRGFDG